MQMIRQLFGYIHLIIGLVVGIQFLAYPIYEGDTANDIWDILNWIMAIAVIAGLFFSFMRWRYSRNAELGEKIWATVMLVAASALFLLYIEQWFTWSLFAEADAETSEYRSLLWVLIDVLFIVFNIAIGCRLLTTPGPTSQ